MTDKEVLQHKLLVLEERMRINRIKAQEVADENHAILQLIRSLEVL